MTLVHTYTIQTPKLLQHHFTGGKYGQFNTKKIVHIYNSGLC